MEKQEKASPTQVSSDNVSQVQEAAKQTSEDFATEYHSDTDSDGVSDFGSDFDDFDFVDDIKDGVENDGVDGIFGVLPVILKYTKPPIMITTNMTMIAIAAAAAELIPTGSGTIGLPDGLTMTPEK